MPSSHFRDHTEFGRLLAKARAGSPDALGRILMECREYLLLTADRKLDPELRRKASASDLVQETFLEAQRDFVRFQGERTEELLAWLCQILHHNVANAARCYHGTEKRAVDRESNPVRLPEVADDTPTPSRRAASREESTALESALSQLPENYRRVLHLRYQEKQSFAQIGVTLSCSAEAARKLWGRAVRSLQKTLEASHESR
jgi:RNA polymerase sigma-70 factor (ECF subfamily)